MDRLAHRRVRALRVGLMDLGRACRQPICRRQIHQHRWIHRRSLLHHVQHLRSRLWWLVLVVYTRWVGPSCVQLVVGLVREEGQRFRLE